MKQKAPARRVEKYDAEIIALRAELAKLAQVRRDGIRNLTISSEDLENVSGQIDQVKAKIEARGELRAQAAKMDAAESFQRERKTMRQTHEQVLQAIGSRESDAAELDQLCTQIGIVLQRIAQKNAEGWSLFRILSRYATQGDAHRARYDSLINSNQSRIALGGAASDALVLALKKAGLGRVGILETNALDGVATYRTNADRTIEEAMHDANERVARHLAVVLHQTAEHLLLADDDAEEREPAPTPVIDYSRPPVA